MNPTAPASNRPSADTNFMFVGSRRRMAEPAAPNRRAHHWPTAPTDDAQPNAAPAAVRPQTTLLGGLKNAAKISGQAAAKAIRFAVFAAGMTAAAAAALLGAAVGLAAGAIGLIAGSAWRAMVAAIPSRELLEQTLASALALGVAVGLTVSAGTVAGCNVISRATGLPDLPEDPTFQNV